MANRNIFSFSNNNGADHITNRVERQGLAYNEALEYCRIYGLDHKENIVPKINNNEISGYYVLDETLSTTVATINL